jgi:hypothetical protein
MNKKGRNAMNRESKNRPPAREEAAAWRLMGEAFVRVLRSDRVDLPERARALQLAEWLNANVLTSEQQHQFMTGTGWIIDSELADKLQGTAAAERPRRGRKARAPEVPF